MSNEDAHGQESSEAADPVLGRCLHVYEAHAKTNTSDKTRRQLEILGVLAVAMVPISLVYVKGTVGTALAIFGGVVALFAYYLSARKPVVRSTTIELHDRGVVCREGGAERQVLWNEVVDVKTKRFALPDGRTSVAIALEVVGAPPLLFVLTGTFKEQDRAGKLVDALSAVWLPVWCRRVRALVESGRDVAVGRARLSGECLSIGEETVEWSEVEGVEASGTGEDLRVSGGVKAVEVEGAVTPFPSTARRLLALAQEPPSRPLLPGPLK
jgi:hypothetical protein